MRIMRRHAIEVLTKAVERYGKMAEGSKLKYWLADSYRKSVAALDVELQQQLSNKQHNELSVERNRRLKKAQDFYHEAKSELEGKGYGALSALEKMYLRNSYFYKADCAYDQQHYELAIELYDEAARRWEKDPSSMVALVQIVNAHCELGQYRQAKIAYDKASWQLQRIPEEAFEQPGLPLTREHWEDWLTWSRELKLFDKNVKGSKASAGS